MIAQPHMTNAPTPAGMAERLMREFYLSSAYDPKAVRPADTVQAAIAFALAAQPSAGAEPVAWQKWSRDNPPPDDGTWFVARAPIGSSWQTRVVHYADKGDRLPIDHTERAWSTVPTEWISLTNYAATPVQPDSGDILTGESYFEVGMDGDWKVRRPSSAVDGLIADLHRRADSCHDLNKPEQTEHARGRLHGKEAAYRHAAEMVREIKDASALTQSDSLGVVEALRGARRGEIAQMICGFKLRRGEDTATDRAWNDALKTTDRILAALAPVAAEGGVLDVALFDHAWKMVEAIRGGGTPPFLTPEEAANQAAPYLLSRLAERNAALRTEPTGGGEGA